MEIKVVSSFDGTSQPSLFYPAESKTKRPLLIGDDFVLVGFKETEWLEKLNK